ncbi:hypothetical protein Xmir_00180 [Xenorhabdus miraniensis]|uniref:Uncharacterized protein n=1 Tax=Xenorhabdus miraniensis TaxID=351674 RepID=A0A2D0JWR8_9GAMM|nr:hypothetical protein Xmir_00180 [Xenorhabdus miraniensis]
MSFPLIERFPFVVSIPDNHNNDNRHFVAIPSEFYIQWNSIPMNDGGCAQSDETEVSCSATQKKTFP